MQSCIGLQIGTKRQPDCRCPVHLHDKIWLKSNFKICGCICIALDGEIVGWLIRCERNPLIGASVIAYADTKFIKTQLELFRNIHSPSGATLDLYV